MISNCLISPVDMPIDYSCKKLQFFKSNNLIWYADSVFHETPGDLAGTLAASWLKLFKKPVGGF